MSLRDNTSDLETLRKTKISPYDYQFMVIGNPYYGIRFMTGKGYQIMTDIGFSQPAQWFNGSGGIPSIRRRAIDRLEQAMNEQGLELDKDWKGILEEADRQDSVNSGIISRRPRYFKNSYSPIDHLDNVWNACGYAIVDAELKSEGMQGLIADNSFFIVEEDDLRGEFSEL